MKLQTVVAVAVAALLASAGAAAAMPPEAQHGADENAAADEHAPNGSAPPAHANASVQAGENASAAQGPPLSLPAQVPDHVSEIHDGIRQFADGALDSTLGEAVSSVTGDASPADA